jgi:hypothetical protein
VPHPLIVQQLEEKYSDLAAMKISLPFQCLLLILLSACGGLFPASPLTPTPIPATQPPTATIVWFPPTNTATFFPTLTVPSTPDPRPGLGELLFTDTFNQPSLWNISSSGLASASITRNRLILSISGPGPLPISSLRSQPLLGDFYAEATVELSLCGNTDQFGMIYHASPGDSWYRYTLRCDGQLRFERSLNGSRSILLDWQPSGDAPIAAPAGVKLGVWSVGREMRFFLNDNYQFTIRDSYLPAGTLGFFAFASATTPITVSFSDLVVYSVSYLTPTPSPAPSQPPTP